MHEPHTVHQKVDRGTDQSFGYVFAAVFFIISVAGYWNETSWHVYTSACSLCFLTLAALKPAYLAPLNWFWFKFGLLLHKIITPLIMGILFFGVITPFALIMRIIKKVPLKLEKDPSAKTYWISKPKDQTSTDFKRQF